MAYLALAADFPARVSELVEHSPIGTQSGPCLGAGLKSRAGAHGTMGLYGS